MSWLQKLGIAVAIYFGLASIEEVDQFSAQGWLRMIAVFALLIALPEKEKKP